MVGTRLRLVVSLGDLGRVERRIGPQDAREALFDAGFAGVRSADVEARPVRRHGPTHASFALDDTNLAGALAKAGRSGSGVSACTGTATSVSPTVTSAKSLWLHRGTDVAEVER
jgi:hypothetical protein